MDLDGIPVKYHSLYRRAMSGRSRKAATRIFCLQCVGWQPSEVAKCTAPSCPLFPYRMSSGVDSRHLSEQAAAIAAKVDPGATG